MEGVRRRLRVRGGIHRGGEGGRGRGRGPARGKAQAEVEEEGEGEEDLKPENMLKEEEDQIYQMKVAQH